MDFHWFRRKGWFYLPVSWIGWATLLSAFVYVVYKFRVIDSDSHSVSDTLINWGFQLLLTGAVYTFIGYWASRTT
ncbi:MAG: hypothetical protein ABI761_12840 [Saprospiraceae bacterium]